jgi:hypothetical protein
VLRLQHAKFKAGGGVTTFGSRGGIMLRRTSAPLPRRVEAGSTGTYMARRGGRPTPALHRRPRDRSPRPVDSAL